MADWQNAFTTYATGMAFNISLSQDQASLLAYIGAGKYDQWVSRSGHSIFVPTWRGLHRRGLAEHNPACLARLPNRMKAKWVYRLTPAGKHVLELLKLAGVATEVIAANDAKAA